MDKWRCNYLIEWKTLWEKEKLLVMSNFFFSHNIFKSCLLLTRQNGYLWSKGLRMVDKYGAIIIIIILSPSVVNSDRPTWVIVGGDIYVKRLHKSDTPAAVISFDRRSDGICMTEHSVIKC